LKTQPQKNINLRYGKKEKRNMSYSKKTLWSVIAALMIFTMLLSACAAPAAPAPAPEKIIETVVVEKQVEVEKIVEVTPTAGAAGKFAGREINMLAGQPHIVGCRNLAKWFEEQTGARVNCLAVPYPNLPEKGTLDVTSGAGEYDVMQYWYPSLGSMVENGVLVDLTEWWDSNAAKFKVDDIFPGFLDPYTLMNGKRYGIPYDGDQHLLFYNTTIFKKYNIAKPPATWDEYLEICKKITEGEKASGSGVYGCGIMASKIPLILIGTFLNRLSTFGGEFFDAAGNPTVNSPEAVAALEHLMKEVPYALPDPKAVAFDELLGPWTTGRVGMIEFWTDVGQMSDNPAQSKIVGEWGVAPMPQGPAPKGRVAAPMNAGWALGLSPLAKDKEVAMAFLEFVMDPATNVKLNTVVGGIDPVRKSTFDNPDFIKWVTPKEAEAAKASASSSLVAWPNMAQWPELQDVLNESLAKVLNGDKQPKQALDETQAAWLKILGK
jgi:multiple sugar transport system substrate-binding protein